MDQLTYKQLQKLAKEHGIPANIKKTNMILLLTAAMKDKKINESQVQSNEDNEDKSSMIQSEPAGDVSQEGQDNVNEVTDQFNELNVDQCNNSLEQTYDLNECNIHDGENSSENDEIVIDQSQSDTIDTTESTSEGDTDVQSELTQDSNSEEYETNGSEEMRSESVEETNVLNETTNSSEPGSETQSLKENAQCCKGEDYEADSSNSLPSFENPTHRSPSIQENELSKKRMLQQNLSTLPFNDLVKVATSLGIPTNISHKTMIATIVENQMALQANVVVETEYNKTPTTPHNNDIKSAGKISSEEIDIIFDGVLDEEDEKEESYDVSSFKKKLFSTPAKNTKIVFASPSPSQRGTMPYEKYNVTWTYDDYENKNPQQSQEIPAGQWNDKKVEKSSQRAITKMKGIATPNGKKTIFKSPTNSAEKPYYKYNVHWSYDQYSA